jgi:UDPglucose--hexose-1-phosphate uridylyltransferase
MPEFRRDPTTGNWVILAAERAKRPGSTRSDQVRQKTAEIDPACPFCAGNEDETPPEILRRPTAGPWVVRVVPNKYPALVPDLPEPRPSDDTSLHAHAPARGHYEVIVEGPVHRLESTSDDPVVLRESFRAAQERYRSFLKDPALQFFSLFKNHGVGAGASLVHPHWQLVASPLLPPSLRQALEVAVAYWEHHGRSVYDDVAARELKVGERLVEETSRFVVLTPYAPQWSGETWIVPRVPGGDFGKVDDDSIEAFAEVLRDTLYRVAQAFDDPPINVLIVSAPLRTENAEGFRWHVRIQPRMTTLGGFELVSGMSITTLVPEAVADALRSVSLGSGLHTP